MAMILPKGILENTREIYAEVASYDIVPPEKICQYWNGMSIDISSRSLGPTD